jgi:hypothetical protein
MSTAPPSGRPTVPSAGQSEAEFDRKFTPVATMVLMLGYIIIFALLWGSVYFFELLARR